MNDHRLYRVQPNDTLSGIAQRQLGRADRWTEIAKANHLRNPQRLIVGQPLILPADSLLQQMAYGPIRITSADHPAMKPQDRPATIIPARGFTFVIADEMNPIASKVVRKVLLPPKGVTDPVLLEQLFHPERYGFTPRSPGSPVSMGRHVGGRVDSNFVSASDRMFGSPRFEGERFWIDAAKAEGRGQGARNGDNHRGF